MVLYMNGIILTRSNFFIKYIKLIMFYYYIMFSPIIVKDNNTKNIFINDCKKMYDNKDKSFYGIDFEYNMKNKKRVISLMQVILINDSSKYDDIDYHKPIYVLDPMSFNKNDMDLLIKYVFCSYSIKIFHGSDSLDYQYIYEDIIKDKNQFMKFINTSVDTRFLCEISKRIMSRNDNKVTKKCSIYNALLDHNIIDKKLFDKLEKLSSKINYNKEWNINSLTQVQLFYSVYDVYYLYDLLSVITRNVVTVNKIIKTDLISLINRLYRFNMLNKFGIINLSDICKKKIVKINNENINDKIMETPLMKIKYNKKDVTIYVEDILSLDTIRKNIMYCLIYYYINNDAIEEFKKNKYFMYMKGFESVLELMKSIGKKSSSRISCNNT
uniref:3'-5' exonuclease domain-containing protein n=1 Tax=viral metagenome TaxID=1070528 RepID=A0A6C0BDQ0_9ZZZZ